MHSNNRREAFVVTITKRISCAIECPSFVQIITFKPLVTGLFYVNCKENKDDNFKDVGTSIFVNAGGTN